MENTTNIKKNDNSQSHSVYVVIVTYNGAKFIEMCLQSLFESTYPVNIVIIDNASTDETIELVKGYPEVILIENNKNIGFGRANNIGISYALNKGADYIMLLNQDTRVNPDTIDFLVNAACENPEFGIISPLHLNGDGSEIDRNFIIYITKSSSQYFSDLYKGDCKKIYTTKYVNAAGWMLSKECLSILGGFDPLFFMYGEDDEFCQRALNHKVGICLVPSSKIFHYREKSNSILKGRWHKLLLEVKREISSMLVILKNPNRSFIYQIFKTIIIFINKVLLSILNGSIRNILKLIMAYIGILIKLPKIVKHRRICSSTGKHWI